MNMSETSRSRACRSPITIALASGSLCSALPLATVSADEIHPIKITPSLAPERGGEIYINAQTGERVIYFRDQQPGRSGIPPELLWANKYPDPCDPSATKWLDDQRMWYSSLVDIDVAPDLMVSAWHDWVESKGDLEIKWISFEFVTFVPDPNPFGGGIKGHDVFLTFTENDRFTNRSGAIAHSPVALTDLPGDITAGQGTLWTVSIDLGDNVIELGDTDGSSSNPAGVDLDGDGLINSGFVFTCNQPRVGEGDILGARFPEIAGFFEGLTDPLDPSTFPNITDMGPALACPSGNAGVDNDGDGTPDEPNCYIEGDTTTEWPHIPGCDDSIAQPLGSVDTFASIDFNGVDAGLYYYGGFGCPEGGNGDGLPWYTPWSSPAFEIGATAFCDYTYCSVDLNPDQVIDLADIIAFAIAFQEGDLLADIYTDGTLNLRDIIAFVSMFEDGCTFCF